MAQLPYSQKADFRSADLTGIVRCTRENGLTPRVSRARRCEASTASPRRRPASILSCRVPHPCGFCKGGDFRMGIFGWGFSDHPSPHSQLSLNLNPHPLKRTKGGAPAHAFLLPAHVKAIRVLYLLVGTNRSPLVSKCMTAHSSRRRYITSGEPAIAIATRSVNCLFMANPSTWKWTTPRWS